MLSTETSQIALRQTPKEIVVVDDSKASVATQGAAEISLWQEPNANPDPSVQTKSIGPLTFGDYG